MKVFQAAVAFISVFVSLFIFYFVIPDYESHYKEIIALALAIALNGVFEIIVRKLK